MVAITQPDSLARYRRQVTFDGVGLAGQRSLASGRALIVGMGGLGSWIAELLARGGVGFLRLADSDRVELTNLHRQALYDEADAQASRMKVDAAAELLGRINSDITVEPCPTRLDRLTIESLAGDVDVILDGTDNFATRFLINDFAVKTGRPWVCAGVVGAEAQTVTIIPGRTPCLRCLLQGPPQACADPNCRNLGVIGPAVAAIAAFEAGEAMKILSGALGAISTYLVKFNVWHNTLHRIDLAACCWTTDCPCCKHGEFEFLEP